MKPKSQGLPLVIVLPKPANQEASCNHVANLLSLDSFIEDGSIFDAELVTIDTERRVKEGINIRDASVSEKVRV